MEAWGKSEKNQDNQILQNSIKQETYCNIGISMQFKNKK
jgi:hypothetical protein